LIALGQCIATDFQYNGTVSFPAASISNPHYMPEPTSALQSRIATLPRYLAASVVIAVCYFSVAWLGLTFAIPPGNATVVWPASGIAVGALYLLGYRLWPAVWTGSCVVNLTTGVSFGVASSFATGNTIEAIVAVWLLKRLLPENAFMGARDAFVFLFIVITSCVPAATIGALSMVLGGRIGADEFGANWTTWFLGDLAGEVIIFPVLLAFAARRWTPMTVARLFELLLLFGLQVVLSFFLFGGLLPERLAEQVLYLPMVLLIWCSLRFELVEVTAGTLLFSTAAILGAWAGVGVYGSNASHETLFDLQFLLLTYAMTSLVVSSIVAGQRTAQSSSQRSRAELRQETAERRRIEAWFRQLLTASPDALIVSDSNGRILLVNEAAENLFGYSSSEMIGQAVEMLVPDRYREMHREQRARYAKSPYLRLMGAGTELTACRKDGSEFAAEIALGPTNTDEGLVVFSAVRDISARKESEKALRDSEERFALAVAGTDAGIWDWDLRTDDVYFSPTWKSMLGYAPDELEDELHEWETRLHPDDRERALRTVREYLDGNTPDFELEHRLRHKHGSYRWILARGAVVRDDSGRPYRMAGSHLDITDRKSMEQKLRVQLAQLIAAEEMQSHLLPEASPEVPGFEIAGKCYPAEFAAGDHFDFLLLKDGTFVTVIGDVSGHGVGPAILMAFLHAHLRSLAESQTDLCAVINRANDLLEQESPDQHFVTLLAVAFDTQARAMTYVRCGHPPGFIMSAQGEVSAWMEEGNLPLGILPDTEFPQSAPTQLSSGDVVVVLTDGILEALSPERTQFGIDRTVQLVREHRKQPAAQIIEALREAVRKYTGRDELSDDLTLVVIKVE
jgi:PAS domain S-box-containing protein